MIPLRPTAQTSQSHALTHATGGTDPLTPAAIGAAAASHIHAENQIQSQPIILEPGWGNFSAPWGNCQVSLLNNTVRLRGLITSASPNTRLLSILPEIYRPNQNILLNCIALTSAVPVRHILCALEITSNGNFSIHDIRMVPINDIHWINITSSFIKS